MYNFATSMTRKMTSVRAILLLTGLFVFVATAAPGASATGSTIVVTSTIQAAIDAANPGDTIVVPPGTYHESVTVTKNNITISGSHGAVIDAGNRIGIRVGTGRRTEVDGVSVCPPSELSNFTLKGLTIRNARFAGVFLIGVNGYRLTGTKYIDNPVYGPFPVCSQNGLIDFNYVEGGDVTGPDVGVDAGIYVGDSDAVIVRKNFVTKYAIGVEIENSSNAVVQDNVLRGNASGILVVVLPGRDKPLTENIRIERNLVQQNNLPNPVSADSGDPVGVIPTGTGILNVGGDSVIIRNNIVIENDTLGIAIVQNGFAALDPRIEPNPDGNEVRGNVILRNGRHPDAVRATTPGADIVYDGTGAGTCFANNIFREAFPDGITRSFRCR